MYRLYPLAPSSKTAGTNFFFTSILFNTRFPSLEVSKESGSPLLVSYKSPSAEEYSKEVDCVKVIFTISSQSTFSTEFKDDVSKEVLMIKILG